MWLIFVGVKGHANDRYRSDGSTGDRGGDEQGGNGNGKEVIKIWLLFVG